MITNLEFSPTQRLYIIPQDPVTRDFLLAVDRKTKADVEKRFDVMIDYDWYSNTISTCVLQSIITAIAFDTKSNEKNSYFNFFDLFSARVTFKKNEDAEKEGNINIAFEPGTKAIALISETVPDNEKEYEKITPEAYFYTDNEALAEGYNMVERFARYDLSQRYAITISDKYKYCLFAITYVFFENIFKGLLYELSKDQDSGLASVNFNDLLEIHAMIKDGGVLFTMRPGVEAKLLVKSDEMTEEEGL